MSEKLTRTQIIQALLALNEECSHLGVTGEICIYGGAEIVLVFDARDATRDGDAVFRPKSDIFQAARSVAEDLNLPAAWLNDGVKGLSHDEKLNDTPVPELEGLSNLRIVHPTAEYLLAMKCMAARSEETSQDLADVKFLLRSLHLTTERLSWRSLDDFYPPDRLHVRTRYFVGEAVADL